MGETTPFAVADETRPESNRLRQPTNPWLLDEVCQFIERQIEECGEPDEGNEWEPERYARVAAQGLLREGLISLRPGRVRMPTDVEVEQAIVWLKGLHDRSLRSAPGGWAEGGIYPRDASEAQRVVNVLNALREDSALARAKGPSHD